MTVVEAPEMVAVFLGMSDHVAAAGQKHFLSEGHYVEAFAVNAQSLQS